MGVLGKGKCVAEPSHGLQCEEGDYRFCFSCGARLSAAPRAECPPELHEALAHTVGWKFCPWCGGSFFPESREQEVVR